MEPGFPRRVTFTASRVTPAKIKSKFPDKFEFPYLMSKLPIFLVSLVLGF